ncbi:hypothetical protein B7P43_G17836, partial [Cryptotermes secundus]
LFDASKEVGLEVNTEKTKYMLLSHHQNAEQNHDIKVGNRCFENSAQFRYIRITITNISDINGGTKEGEVGRACSMNGEKRNAYRILVGKPEGKRPQGRPRRRWVDNIRMDLREIEWYGLDRSGSG